MAGLATRAAMRAALLAALLGLAGTSASGDAKVRQKIDELKQLLKEDNTRLQSLEEGQAEARRLQGLTPSLYGDKNGTRAYTPLESLQGGLDHAWLILCGTLVMFMQAGFAMVEGGTCRVKNVQSILLKNFTDVAVGTLGWWIFGWSFAYSGPKDADGLMDNRFAGKEQFVGHTFLEARDDGQQEPTTAIVNWYFQWAFCATAATIVSGGVAERVNFPGYVIFSFLMTSFIYPIVVAWSWGGGWMSDIHNLDVTYMDFAGSGVVHLTGGVAALVGAAVAGARNGRFDDMTLKQRLTDVPDKFVPHSTPLVVLGTFILWFGWYGFNCGITFALNDIEKGMLAAHIAMNTTIAASTAGLLAYAIRLALNKGSDISGFCNGILAGLVSISASCSSVECGSACAIGAVGALVYIGFSALLRVLKVDDPVDAFAVHGACGMWGVWAAFLFDWGKAFVTVHGARGFRCMPGTNGNCAGLSDSLGKSLFATSTAEVFAIIGWVFLLTAVIVLPMRFVPTRDADGVKESGYDQTKHTPKNAYDMEMVLPHTVI